MANIREMTPEQELEINAEFDEWAKDRPQVIRDLAARFKPWKLYRLKSSNHRVFPMSLNEAGTITVAVIGRFNLVSMERQVFGILPEDLEECDLPALDEVVGVYLTEQEQHLMVNRRRAEHGNPPLTFEQFKKYGQEGEPYVRGPKGEIAGEPIDSDVPPGPAQRS